jgi:hypothetical protein
MSTTLTKKALKTHSFTLVFEGQFDDLSDDLVNAVWEAGCDDSHISLRQGTLRIAFDREAPSYWAALLSAVADIERTGLGLDLAIIEAD